MPRSLTDTDLGELAGILEKLEYRLVTSDGQRLAEAAPGEVLVDGLPPEGNSFRLDLAPELGMLRRARAILAGDSTEEQAQKDAVARGMAKGLGR